MTEATEAKAKAIIDSVNLQLNEHLLALLSLAGNSGCSVVINIAPGHKKAVIDFRPPKKQIKLRK